MLRYIINASYIGIIIAGIGLGIYATAKHWSGERRAAGGLSISPHNAASFLTDRE